MYVQLHAILTRETVGALYGKKQSGDGHDPGCLPEGTETRTRAPWALGSGPSPGNQRMSERSSGSPEHGWRRRRRQALRAGGGSQSAVRLRSASPLAGPLVRITAMAQRPWPELSAKMVFLGTKDSAPVLQRAHSLEIGEETSKRMQNAGPRGEQGRRNGRPRKPKLCELRPGDGHGSTRSSGWRTGVWNFKGQTWGVKQSLPP